MECCRLYQKSCFLFFYQTFALTLKNVLYSIHHIFQTIFQILLPAVLLLLIYVVESNTKKTQQSITYTIGDSETIIDSDKKIMYEIFGETSEDDCLNLIQEMATISNYEFTDDVVYTKSNYSKCEKGRFCRYSGYSEHCYRDPFMCFPPNDLFTEGDVYQTIGLECDEGRREIDFSVLKNSSSGYTNPFMLQSSGPSIQLFDTSMSMQKLFYTAFYSRYSSDEELNMDIEYTQFLQSKAAAEGSVNDLINLIIYSVIYLCIFLTTIMLHFKINSERRQNLIYGLQLNGMKESAYWCSWCVCESSMLFISVNVMLVFGLILNYDFFKDVNYVALFMIVYFFGLNQMVYWMCSATMCSGMLCTVINAFATALFSAIFLQIFMINVSYIATLASAPVAFLFQIIPAFNLAKLFWDINLNVENNKDSHFDFVDLFYHSYWDEYKIVIPIVPPVASLIFLLLEALGLFLITCYCDVVWPSRWKSSRPFYFVCSLKYWGLISGNDRAAVDVVVHDSSKAGSVIPDLDTDIYHEYQKVMKAVKEDRGGEKVPLKIVHISKTFTKLLSRRKAVIALSGINLSAELGTCFVILGHNGAGKTTLINILNGTLNSSTGDALIFGRSAVTNMDLIRGMTGVCPQFDTVFDSLTVVQHLFLFASLKGMWITDPQITELLDYLELKNLRHQTASKCSGGEKRRLTFAASVMGNPKIIFLDEPTSGLDPVRKRRVWNYVNKIKKGRVVVLTTHSMEEADRIGDKVAFLALGRIRAVGGTEHLKKRFGFGSQLDILLQSYIDTEGFKDELGDIIRTTKVRYKHETGSLLTYVIPHTVRKEEKLGVFRFLEDRKSQGVIKQFGVSPTTLEEVFMNVTHGSSEIFESLNNKLDDEGGLSGHDELGRHGSSLIRVVVEDEIEPFATMEVGRRDSLEDIRNHIEETCKNLLRSDFVFLSKENKNVQIMKLQEKNERAIKYSPLILIRYVGGRSGGGGQFEEIIEISGSVDGEETSSSREKLLMQRLEEKDGIIQHQAEEIEMVRREIQILREEIKRKKRKSNIMKEVMLDQDEEEEEGEGEEIVISEEEVEKE